MQADLEDQILKMLSSATGSLLDNIELINALDASKATFETVTQSLVVRLVPELATTALTLSLSISVVPQ